MCVYIAFRVSALKKSLGKGSSECYGNTRGGLESAGRAFTATASEALAVLVLIGGVCLSDHVRVVSSAVTGAPVGPGKIRNDGAEARLLIRGEPIGIRCVRRIKVGVHTGWDVLDVGRKTAPTIGGRGLSGNHGGHDEAGSDNGLETHGYNGKEVDVVL